MAVYQTIKRYSNFLGLDLKSSDVTRSPDAASSTSNAIIFQAGKNPILSCRKGGKVIAKGRGGTGLHKYFNTDFTTGSGTTEILTTDAQLWKLASGSITISYTGSATNISCLVIVEDSTWKLKLIEDDVATFETDLGIGYDEISTVTLANLKTTIDALADYSMSITGTTSTPAAFLPLTYYQAFSAGSLTISFSYWSQVNQPTTAANPFSSHYSSRNTAAFRNTTAVNLNNILYIANGLGPLKKYDGQKVYSAGMPTGSSITATVVPNATGRTGTNITYQITYLQYDAKGNVIEGNPSSASNTVSPAADYVDIALTPLLASSGYNTDAAMVVGAQAAVTTINVDDGAGGAHTLKAGDTAYFFDSVSGGYVARSISSVATNTITISGAAVTVADNDPISANLRIGLYVQQTANGAFYLVKEYPNNPFVGTQTIRDLGAAVGEQYLPPILTPTVPPNFRYITTHQGLLVGTGNPAAPNDVYFSDIANIESFPAENSFRCQNSSNEPNTSIASNNEFLVVLKATGYFVTSGLLYTNEYRVDLVSAGVGNYSPHAIADISGAITILDSSGPYSLTGGGLPTFVGELISAPFVVPASSLNINKAIGVNDIRGQKYLLFVPEEASFGGEIYASTASRIFVWDYYNKVWFEWAGLNLAGGAVVDTEDFYIMSRKLSNATSSVDSLLYKRGDRDDDLDQADHHEPIRWEYIPGWESLGEPSVYKKFTRLKMLPTTAEYSPNFTLDIKTEHNYLASIYHTEASVVFGASADGSGWGASFYGSAPWGDPAGIAEKIKLKGMKCQALRVIFSHETIYERPLLLGWELEAVTPYRVAIKE